MPRGLTELLLIIAFAGLRATYPYRRITKKQKEQLEGVGKEELKKARNVLKMRDNVFLWADILVLVFSLILISFCAFGKLLMSAKVTTIIFIIIFIAELLFFLFSYWTFKNSFDAVIQEKSSCKATEQKS